MNTDRPLWGLVLAGGRSRRMGSDKAALTKDGKTQLQRTYDLLSEHLERVYVSARSDQADDAHRSQYPVIVDRDEAKGPVAGILSAMHEHAGVSWLVVACDLPNLDSDTVRNLIDRHDREDVFTAYRSSYDGLPEPLCAIYGRESADVIRRFVAEDVMCPRKMMIRSEATLLSQIRPASLDNVNTPDDLAGSGAAVASSAT